MAKNDSVMNSDGAPARGRRNLLHGAAVAVAALLAAPAQAAPVNAMLGAARDYTVFAASTTGRDFQFNKAIIRGRLGVGPNIKPAIGAGSQLVSDCIYDAGFAANLCLLITSHTGGVKTKAELAPVVKDINEAAAFIRKLAPTRIINGDLTHNTKPPIVSAGPGSVNIIRVTGNVKFSAPLVITGGPTDYFLFDVAKQFTCSKAYQIQLQGGVPASNVLFVVGDRVNTAGGCGWSGTVIAPKVGSDNSVDNANIPEGALLVPDGKLAFTANAKITGKPFTVYDYGDAPDRYGVTYAGNGARHAFSAAGPRLGARLDAETDGQPDVDAISDDNTGYIPQDEDGVAARDLYFTAGQSAKITVTVNNPSSKSARLGCWLDLAGAGTFTGLAPRAESIAAGAVNQQIPLDFGPVPAGAPALTYLRCRIGASLPLTTAGVLSPVGPAPDGEVEDYAVNIASQPAYDWGDAPQDDTDDYPNYATLASSNGPRHKLGSGLMLGQHVDDETNGQPSARATGDDDYPVGGINDEDGIDVTNLFFKPGANRFDIAINNPLNKPATLNCWLDVSRDGAFSNDEKMAALSIDAFFKGSKAVPFSIPATAEEAITFLRCRLATAAAEVAQSTGLASDGEVEDYRVVIKQPQAILDWGDAPEPPYYSGEPNGPGHILGDDWGSTGNLTLGQYADGEPFALTNDDATGDDLDVYNGQMDEDGVDPAALNYSQGQQNATLNVAVNNRLSVAARVVCWIDFDGDGRFSEGEKIASADASPGFNGALPFTFNVPASSVLRTFLRCRVGSTPAEVEQPGGGARDGEAEDYLVTIQGVETTEY